MNPCTHEIRRGEWVSEEETPYGIEPGHWRYETVPTTEDIDTGRYRCTQCGEVMYYTGLWREHWEDGRQLLDERTGSIRAARSSEEKK